MIGAAEGSYRGKPGERAYEIRIHGLLKPASVKLRTRELPEKTQLEGGSGWLWDHTTGVITVQLVEPIPVKETAIVTVENAGDFADAVALQDAHDFRDRVRRVKHEQKLKYIMLADMGDHSKPPRVFRETEKVESRLSELIANPRGIARNRPDYKAMTEAVLAALVDQPFESKRTIPDLNETCRQATEQIANARFQPAEVDKMAGILLGMELPSRVVVDKPEIINSGRYIHVLAKLTYDENAIGPAATTSLQLVAPDGLPGWAVDNPVVVQDGYTQFDLRQPTELGPGRYIFKVKATLGWDKGKVELWRDVELRR
jgi:hypothetical protein